MPQRADTGFNILRAPRGWILPAAAIVAITALAYIPAMHAGFIWNDDTFLTENPLIRAPDGLYRFWFTTEPPDYFPLTSSVLWVEWRLWHMNPAGYHVVNVLLHAAGAVLLWRVLCRLKLPGAWLAGVIFAVHPVNAESVAWITEHKNTLPLVFGAASLLVFLNFDEKAGPAFPRFQLFKYLLSLALFLLALLSKTSVVMLPVVLLLCAWWRRGRVARKDFLLSLPFLALSLALSAATVWFQYHRAIGPEVVRTDGLLERTAGAGWAAWFYLYKAVVPLALCFVYPRWRTSASVFSFAPGLLLVAAMVIFWRHRDGWGRAFFFGLGSFLVMLLPVLGFLNVYFMRYSLVADHWQYTALIGIVALGAGGLARMTQAGGLIRKIGIGAAAAVVALFAAATWRQSLIYRNSETLWRDTLRRNPDAWLAWLNLGKIYSAAGRCEEAIRCCDRTIQLKKDEAEAYNDRAIALARSGRYELALRDCGKAIELKPGYAVAYYNRGTIHAQANDLADALADFDEAIALGRSARFYNARAGACIRLGRIEAALGDYGKAIELMPDNPAPYANRAMAYYKTGEYGKAWADVKMSEKLGGRSNPEFLNALEQAAPRPE